MSFNDKTLYSAEDAVSIVRNTCFMQVCLISVIRFLVYWCFFVGIVVLLFRMFHFNSPLLSMFLFGFPLAIVYGVDYAYKNRLSEDNCIASIDAYNKAGGLLMTEHETGNRSWKIYRKTKFEIPQIDYLQDFKKLFGILIIALLFVWGSFHVPLLNFNKIGGRKINLSKKVTEIRDQIDLLAQEDIITSEEREVLENSLDNIVKNSDKEAPGITFEALDQMSEKLKYEVSEDLKKRIKDIETLHKLEDFVHKAKQKEADSKMFNEELEKLKNQLRQMGMNEAQINDFLKQQLGIDSNSGLSKQQISNVSKNLSNNINQKKLDSSELADKLLDKNLVDEATAEKIKQSLDSKESENSDSGNGENGFFEVGKDNGNQPKQESKQSGQEGKESGQEGSQSGQDGKQSGQEGSQSVQEGGQSGQEGGQPGQEGGQSGQEGGQSGQEGGQSGQKGGQSGQEGGQSSQGGGQSSQEGGQSGQEGGSNNGVGGISRGGGQTPMTFGDKASDHNAKYHDETLPSVNPESALGASVIGIGVADPMINKEKEDYTPTNIKSPKKVDNSLNKKNILPKHRNAVKNYFNQ
ncbi:MAG: hypothetical protein II961_05625 [Candidatus Riflebacteria bacterium]|nr:hypothetical protein [Candidatus Riflebacteria bacterium]